MSTMREHHDERRERSRQRDERSGGAESGGWGDDELAAPPGSDELRNVARQGVHDALLHRRWRGHVTTGFGHLRHALPELNIALSVAVSHRGLRQLAIEPRVDRRRKLPAGVRLRQRYFAVGERILEL